MKQLCLASGGQRKLRRRKGLLPKGFRQSGGRRRPKRPESCPTNHKNRQRRAYSSYGQPERQAFRGFQTACPIVKTGVLTFSPTTCNCFIAAGL